jgi:hypothetical protein
MGKYALGSGSACAVIGVVEGAKLRFALITPSTPVPLIRFTCFYRRCLQQPLGVSGNQEAAHDRAYC